MVSSATKLSPPASSAPPLPLHPSAPSFRPLPVAVPWIHRHAWLLAGLLPLACHFGFSWIGFNPTDEGWLQAVARRLLEGEVPHRDFISVRPVLSPLLQVPLVWLGGDHLFWWARLWGWGELALISWWWSGLLGPAAHSPLPRVGAFAAALLLNAHVFPVMAWHTLDGLVFCTAAVLLARRGSVTAWRWAFCCVGLAALCRQNFGLFVPVLALGLPDWRSARHVLWAAVPPALYFGGLVAGHAVPDFFQQLYASGGALYKTAFRQFAVQSEFWLSAGLAALGATLLLRLPRRLPGISGALALAAGLRAAWCLAGDGSAIGGSFELFGAALVLTAATLSRGRWAEARRSPLVAAVALAWIGAISHGYNNPALSGGLLFLVIVQALSALGDPADKFPPLLAPTVALLALAPAFVHARQTYPYLDRPTSALTHDAGDVVRGATHLRTNELTYRVLTDLRLITDRLEANGTPYAILTDFSAVWALSPRRNPLLCEWPQTTELGSKPALIVRFLDHLCSLPPGTVVIVQRHLVSYSKFGLVAVPPAEPFYVMQHWLTEHGQKIASTRFFETYVPPRLAPAAADRPPPARP